MNQKKLYRSKQDKMIAGVCGGIAEYFDVDPVWVRLATVLLILINGVGILMYIVAWIIIPQNPYQKDTKDTKAEEFVARIKKKAGKEHKEKITKEVVLPKRRDNGGIFFGGFLVLLGVFLLLDKIYFWFNFKYFFPAILILLGIHIILKRSK